MVNDLAKSSDLGSMNASEGISDAVFKIAV